MVVLLWPVALDFLHPEDEIYVIRTNAYGDTLWTRTYDKSTSDVAMSIQQTSDSNFIIAAITYDTTFYKNNTYLIKIDSLGDTLWTKQHYSLDAIEIYSLQQTKDNGFVGVGTIFNGVPLHGYLHLFKANSNGDLEWTKQFGSPPGALGTFVRQTKDGGYIISGQTFGSTGAKAYIIKTDSTGNVLTGLNHPERNNPVCFSVYPNPSSGNFTFQFKGIPKKRAELRIYNIMNQCVYTGTLSSYKKESVDLHHLSNGIYIATLYYGARTVSEKVIIHK
ncbi:MAG: T9SS type A sorting domain-containing protein [Bacteroidia bacterium]